MRTLAVNPEEPEEPETLRSLNRSVFRSFENPPGLLQGFGPAVAQPAVEGGDKGTGHQHEDQDILQAVLQPRIVLQILATSQKQAMVCLRFQEDSYRDPLSCQPLATSLASSTTITILICRRCRYRHSFFQHSLAGCSLSSFVPQAFRNPTFRKRHLLEQSLTSRTLNQHLSADCKPTTPWSNKPHVTRSPKIGKWRGWFRAQGREEHTSFSFKLNFGDLGSESWPAEVLSVSGFR